MEKLTDIEVILKQMLDDIQAWNWPADSNKEKELKKLGAFLDSISNEKINQALQSQIVKNSDTSDVIDKIPNITGETLINYLDSNHINEQRIELLFSLYKEKIEPNLEEFKTNEYSKQLKMSLLQKLVKQRIIKNKNLECLKLYNQINACDPKLEPDDEKIIVENNPWYIGDVPTPSSELQLLSAKNIIYPILTLQLVENPSDLLYAYLLTQYEYKNQNFKGKFENGVPQEILDEVVNLKPSIVFGNCNYTGHNFTSEEKEAVLTRFPNTFKFTKKEDITPNMVLIAIKHLPLNLEHIGTNLNIYSQPILDYTIAMASGYKPENQAEEMLLQKTITDYKEVIDKRNEAIIQQNKTDEKFLVLIKKY